MASKPGNDKELRILRAAISVFARHGYHGSSISTIAEEAGIATGTIYLYFRKKEELIIALFQRFLGDYIREAKEEVLAVHGAPARLGKLIERHLRFFEADHEVAAVFQIHLREVNPQIRDGILPVLLDYFDLIDTILIEGKEAGEIAPDIDVRLARKLIFGGLDEIVTSWVLSRHKYELMSMRDGFHQMITRAVGARWSGFRARASGGD